ncbi:MAG TPA: hypothetical protein DEA08_19195 [Planctomycetes bacterium]|nr:hypothetical protein [Planctomycetota bacterium]
MARGLAGRGETEIDLVALNEDEKVIRFGSCKRTASKLRPDLAAFDQHVERFLGSHKEYKGWTIEKAAIAPVLGDQAERQAIEARGYLPQDLRDLTQGL